jgi:WD40 repeat protein
VSADGSLKVTGSNNATARVWDASNGATVGAPLEGHRIAVQSVAISADGSHVVFGGHDGAVHIWGTESCLPVCEPTRPLDGHEDCVTSVATSADGSWIVSGGTERIWDAASHAPARLMSQWHTK